MIHGCKWPKMESPPEYSLDLSYLDCLVDMVPEDPEIQHILSDIDEELKANALRVEQCLQKLQSEINETCPSELIQDTAGCLLWLNNCSFNSLKPSSTPHGELLEFLRTLLSLLKKQQMEEEAILDLLQDISNRCGVLFPRTPSGTSFHFTSRSSLHAVDDDSSMDVTTVWNDVRLHLRRFLVDKLQSWQGVSSVQSQVQLRAQCLQHLLFLYPESETLTKYQSIQKKLVMDLLNNRTWPTMDEINFEKVVQSYQTSFSVLYKTIREDLVLLSGMIEPASAVKFINETFLEMITEEVAALLKRLGDLHFKEDTRNALKMIRGKHRGAVHAVDSQEPMKKGINVCLHSHQLRSLSQLIKLLLWLEDRVKELYTETLCNPCCRDIDLHFKGKERRSQGAPRRGGGELLAEETEASESRAQPERLPRGAEPAGPRFGWRDALEELSPSVTRCLAAAVDDSSSKILQEEQEQQSTALGWPLSLVSLRQTVPSGTKQEEERPRRILKFCSDIMEELDTLLPLALACRGESLQEMRASFVEACCKVATAVLARLEMRTSEVPSKGPVQTLHAALSSAVYIHQRFTLYEGLMGESNKKSLFLVPVQRYQEFISALRSHITNYCVTVCATSVLQDAESHHWEDRKAFYEGERCSFSIQMWHYFCCGLRHDLWTVLPPKTAQEILAEVLEESLGLLSFRYSQAHPSYKRSPQIRIDVTTVLLCVEHFLWSVCRSVRELCNPTQELCHRILNINSHCNNLLIALFVISAPLKVLYKAFQDGFGDHSPTSREQDIDWRHWLYRMEPSIRPSLPKTPSAREMTTLGQLKLLLSQPYCNQALLLETLLHHDCLIAGILISHSTLVQLQYEDSTNSANSCPGKQTTLTEAIFRVLSHCTLSPRSLCTVLERCFEEHQLWSLLSKMSVNIGTESEPEVFRCLRQSLIDSVMGLVKQIISLILAWDTKKNRGSYPHTQSVTEALLRTVPKGWNYLRKERDLTQSGGNFTALAAQAVSVVFAKLPSVIASLLPSVKYFFLLSEQKLSDCHPRSKEAGLLVWSTLTILSQVLKDGSTAEHLTGALLNRWSLERLGTISVCLEAILTMHESSLQQDTQRVVQSIEKQRPRWIQNQILKAKRLSMEGFPATPEDAAAGEEGGCTLGLTEQKINMMVLDICHKPGGSDYLRQIYHIIQLNEEYLKEILISPNNKRTTNRPLTLDIKGFEERNLIFDPFQAFILPGTTLFNEQSAVNEWNWGWASLLPSCRGLNEATFRAMLAQSFWRQAAHLPDEPRSSK
ncbi:uncharacterized protein KIAA0825 homolog isoform X2 [Pleurodeles waltl]|uniref:uncharacterized protein KIAA0825 homolog isoform X2 n=1 Tax=Pleurodeles waltl TaxID=8319 RepID=UPI0037095FE4